MDIENGNIEQVHRAKGNAKMTKIRKVMHQQKLLHYYITRMKRKTLYMKQKQINMF